MQEKLEKCFKIAGFLYIFFCQKFLDGNHLWATWFEKTIFVSSWNKEYLLLKLFSKVLFWSSHTRPVDNTL
jgi:hypothetical protein